MLVERVKSAFPGAVAELEREVEERLSEAPLRLNEYGYDRYGFHLQRARRLLLPTALLYRFYFRVETHDVGNVPEGKVLLIANHAGQVGASAGAWASTSCGRFRGWA
jgi:hypothetical protein